MVLSLMKDRGEMKAPMLPWGMFEWQSGVLVLSAVVGRQFKSRTGTPHRQVRNGTVAQAIEPALPGQHLIG